jgi:hypothetical protein
MAQEKSQANEKRAAEAQAEKSAEKLESEGRRAGETAAAAAEDGARRTENAMGLANETTDRVFRRMYDLNARSLDRLQRMQGEVAQLATRRAERYASLGRLSSPEALTERPFAAEQSWLEDMMSDYVETNRSLADLMDEQWRDTMELGRAAFGPLMPPKL